MVGDEMTIEEVCEAIYEAECEIYRQWEQLPDEWKHHDLIRKPEKPVFRLPAPQHWTMKNVVTGARRKWRKSS